MKQWRLSSIMLIVVAGMVGCGDHGLDPLPAKISGTVFFVGEKPPETHEVRAAVSVKFPPKSINDLIITEPLPLDTDRARYEVWVDYGTYAVVGVLWKAQGRPYQITDVLGLFSPIPGSPLPAPVTVSKEQPHLEDINITADYNRVRRGAFLKGRITYTGPWPPTTQLVGLAVYPTKPHSDIEKILSLAAIDITLPINVPHWDYRIALPPGTYRYIPVYWYGGGDPYTGIKEVGVYGSSAAPDSVTVAQGDTAKGVDIVADLTKLGFGTNGLPTWLSKK